jgi:hypothetical protein
MGAGTSGVQQLLRTTFVRIVARQPKAGPPAENDVMAMSQADEAASSRRTPRTQFRALRGLQIVLLAFSLFYGTQVVAQVRLSVLPPVPTTADIVSIRIVGTGGAGAGVLSVQVAANRTIVIDVSGSCFSVPTNINLTAVVGRIPAGTYTAIITQTVGCVFHEAPLVFQVQEVGYAESPIPTLSSIGLGLMAAALVVMAWLSLRNRGS